MLERLTFHLIAGLVIGPVGAILALVFRYGITLRGLRSRSQRAAVAEREAAHG
jgi:hypothetical protein